MNIDVPPRGLQTHSCSHVGPRICSISLVLCLYLYLDSCSDFVDGSLLDIASRILHSFLIATVFVV